MHLDNFVLCTRVMRNEEINYNYVALLTVDDISIIFLSATAEGKFNRY